MEARDFSRARIHVKARLPLLTMEKVLDRSSEKPIEERSLWDRICSFFGFHTAGDTLEQVVLEARDEGELDKEEGSMILSILQLDDVQVQDVMTPRTDFDCMSSGVAVSAVAQEIIKTGHSRLPIYQDTRDNIIGIAYAKDLLALLLDREKQSTPVNEIMRTPFFVPETKLVSELLQEFRARKNHIAIAVDEYGGTSGLVTIEDILEQIVGDIEDEHDAPREEDICKLGEGRYELSGRAFLEDLHDLDITLESDEVDTIGGYLCLKAGHVPQAGESFSCDHWLFNVVDSDAKQIHKVICEHQPENPPEISEESKS